MICKNCSAEFDGKFCPDCGTPAEIAEPVAEAPVAETQFNEGEGVTVMKPPSMMPEQEATPAEPEAPVTSAEPEAPAEPAAPEEPTEPAPAYSEPSDDAPYYEPPTDEPAPAPKKKRTGLIVALIVIVVLIAGFCVTAFTDLIIPRKAQFVSVLSNMGSDVETEFTPINSEYYETKYSVKLNGDNSLLNEQMPAEAAELIDLINSITLTTKQGEDKVLMTVFEDGKALANISGILNDDATYLKTDFSDLVVKYPVNDLEIDKYDERAERVAQIILDETKALLEKEEAVKGEYDGVFDIGTEAKTLTITLDETELKVYVQTIAEAFYDEFKTEFEAAGVTREDMDLDDFDLGFKSLSISALYDGAFSFARNSLGVSIVIDDGVEKVEGIFFSNKENYAIYGMGSGDEYFAITDNYEINGNSQSGVLNFETNIADFGEIPDIALTYTIGGNKAEGKLTLVVDGESVVVKGSLVSDGKKVNGTVGVDFNSEELVTVTTETAPCDNFDVNIDTKNALDIMDEDFVDDEALSDFVVDFLTLVEENEPDSKIFDLLLESELFYQPTELEQYMMDEFGIDHLQTTFETSKRASFVAVDYDMIDVQELGYEGDVVVESADTLYMYVGDYTGSQKQQVIAALEESFEYVENVEDAYVEIDFTEDGDIVYLYLYLWNLDNPQNIKEFTQLGLLGGDPDVTELSFSMTADAYLSTGYERVE